MTCTSSTANHSDLFNAVIITTVHGRHYPVEIGAMNEQGPDRMARGHYEAQGMRPGEFIHGCSYFGILQSTSRLYFIFDHSLQLQHQFSSNWSCMASLWTIASLALLQPQMGNHTSAALHDTMKAPLIRTALVAACLQVGRSLMHGRRSCYGLQMLHHQAHMESQSRLALLILSRT